MSYPPLKSLVVRIKVYLGLLDIIYVVPIAFREPELVASVAEGCNNYVCLSNLLLHRLRCSWPPLPLYRNKVW
jgi:hypothetical protein